MMGSVEERGEYLLRVPNVSNAGRVMLITLNGVYLPVPGPERVSALSSFDVLPSLKALAEEQGVSPITDLDELIGDFWPEDESIDDFIATVRRWRREGDTLGS